MIRKSMLAAMAALGAGVAFAAAINVSPATRSTVTAAFKQAGVEVESPFTRFTGSIVYDPKHVAASSATIEVDIASFDIGDEAYNAETRKKAWFDAATYPKGSFKSTAIKAGAAGTFDATGQLTMKGRVMTITVPVKVSTTAAGTVFDGSFVMSRKAFGIGDPIWDDTLEDKVTVRFHLVGGK